MTTLTDPMFHDDDAARAHLEWIRWPNGPTCPHCGNTDQETIRELKGKSHRAGLRQCNECRGHFTVTVGTVMERSKIPLHKWVLGFHLMASSKEGMSAHQLHRSLGITYKSAWFLWHRIREAMGDDDTSAMGSGGGPVEADETFIGHDRSVKPKGSKKGRGYHHKYKVLALVDRETGKARAMIVDDLKAETIGKVVRENVAKEARLMTDEAAYYKKAGKEFAGYEIVHHGRDEYVRDEAHTNTLEGYFSIFKRGMKGVYQHCAPRHVHRYVAEFNFRYNHRVKLGFSDADRAAAAVRGAVGKRLTYHQPDALSQA